MSYQTEQEHFWAADFGNEYIERNQGEPLITSNVVLFGRMLRAASVRSVTELGCNIGLNLQALHRIQPGLALRGYEINQKAAGLARQLNIAEIIEGTILDALPADKTSDLVFAKGVLIHIHPDHLPAVYDNLYRLSNRYVLVCEYYNPSPVSVMYRGVADRLFKRDFAGELMDRFGMKLVDYGFAYRRDKHFPQDDLSWFLLEK